jgi:hypothetical protein
LIYLIQTKLQKSYEINNSFMTYFLKGFNKKIKLRIIHVTKSWWGMVVWRGVWTQSLNGAAFKHRPALQAFGWMTTRILATIINVPHMRALVPKFIVLYRTLS